MCNELNSCSITVFWCGGWSWLQQPYIALVYAEFLKTWVWDLQAAWWQVSPPCPRNYGATRRLQDAVSKNSVAKQASSPLVQVSESGQKMVDWILVWGSCPYPLMVTVFGLWQMGIPFFTQHFRGGWWGRHNVANHDTITNITEKGCCEVPESTSI